MFGIDLDEMKDLASDALGKVGGLSAVTDLLENNEQVKEVLNKVGLGSTSELIEKLPTENLPELVEKVKDDGVDTETIINFVKGFLK